MSWERIGCLFLGGVAAALVGAWSFRRVPRAISNFLDAWSVKVAASAPLTLFVDRSYVKRWVATIPLGVAVAAGAAIIVAPVWGVVAAGVYPMILMQRLSKREEQLQDDLRRQLPDAIEAVATNAASRSSLPAAFRDIIPSAQSPLRDVFNDVAMSYDRGVIFSEALVGTATPLKNRELNLVFDIVAVCFKQGSPLDQVSRRLAVSVRQLQAFRAKIKNETSGVRMGMRIMLVLPVAVLGMMATVEGEAVQAMFENPVGIVMVAVAGGCLFWAMMWGRGVLRSYV